jgi:putative FmdB family regulatory protein
MPLYEYQCDGCGTTFEVLQKFSDSPLTVHQNCGGKLQRLISAPGLQFKGSGWYITDYAKSGANGKNEEAPKKEVKSEKPAAPAAAETKKS